MSLHVVLNKAAVVSARAPVSAAAVSPQDAKTFAELMKSDSSKAAGLGGSSSISGSLGPVGRVLSKFETKPASLASDLSPHLDPNDPIKNDLVMVDVGTKLTGKISSVVVASSVASAAVSSFKSVLKSHE